MSPAESFSHLIELHSSALDGGHSSPPIQAVFLDEINRWLTTQTRWMTLRRHLLSGRELSAVAFDSVGATLPSDWYGHMVRYEPGVGLVKAGANKRYMMRCRCTECDGRDA